MLTIKAPEQYINQPDLLPHAGKYIAEYGHRAFILGGKTALERTGEQLQASLKTWQIAYQITVFSGYPRLQQINFLQQQAQTFNADVIIAVGGGKVCDTAKVVGDKLGLPVVTIPTIAATCAAWAAVSVLYDADGAFVQPYFNRYSPRLVLADTAVILSAPAQYTRAGILDTFAKWYEMEPNRTLDVESTTLSVMLHTAKLAFDLLSRQGENAIAEGQRGLITQAGRDTVDAIIYLAGLVGTIQTEISFGGFAHPYYQASTLLANTRHRLHGEKVALGLLTQFVISGVDFDEFTRRLQIFRRFGLALTLEDIGILDNLEEDIRLLAKQTFIELPLMTKLPFASSAVEIEEAIRQTERWVRQVASEASSTFAQASQ
ncbi:iron-containing alcohol dehydrogenase family protein [Phytobacter sp. V91]|uniref:iron-containing alcohol dehydrogenase family protein n=1 Tax=Phytobacter sp. V91 TaxID=3369425 RepID=UPI003F5F2651